MRREKTYEVDVYFRCRDKARLYKLLDRLKDLAMTYEAHQPYPTYIGQGIFRVVFNGHAAELQDTPIGVVRLTTSPLRKDEYEMVRQVFWDYWNENYSIEVQQTVKQTDRFKIR